MSICNNLCAPCLDAFLFVVNLSNRPNLRNLRMFLASWRLIGKARASGTALQFEGVRS